MAMIHGGDVFASAARAGTDWRQFIDFSASINPLGMSPAAREAILAAVDRVAHYPEREGSRLRKRLAAEWNVEPERIMVGNGATDLLFAWCRHFGAGAIAAPAFSEFHRAWPHAAVFPLEGAWPDAEPVVFTRPANPTGTLVELDTVLRYAARRRDPVLVDESFLDFCDAESSIPRARGNLFVLRSLTKFWALPGLRVGALIGDVSALAASQPPWSVNVIAEEAAITSLDDRHHATRTREFVRTESAWMYEQIARVDEFRPWRPAANYLYVETRRAGEFASFAATRGILVRDCTGWPGLPASAIRVAVRKRWENELLIACCKEFKCA